MTYSISVNARNEGNAEFNVGSAHGDALDDVKAEAERLVSCGGTVCEARSIRFAVVYDEMRKPVATFGTGHRWEN